MKTPSVYIAEELMPFIRARVAERLYESGMKQSQIARYLGITQAMVSKYLAGRYGVPEGLPDEIDEIAADVARTILFGGSKEDAIFVASRRVLEMFQSGKLCAHYAAYAGVSEDVCRRLFLSRGTGAEILSQLTSALRALENLDGFSRLIPAVRSNFVYAPEMPTGIDDVAAVPGRITSVRGKVFALPPEFGASRFTASLVLEVMRKVPELRSVINIRYGRDVEAAIQRAGFSVMRTRTGGMSDGEAVRAIAGLFDAPHDAVIDEGGEGVEPMVYVFGKDPLEVVEKVKAILGVME